MFDSMQNGWAERDYAHYENEARYEARTALRDEFLDEILTDLISIGQSHGQNARRLQAIEQQQRNEAMEAALDWLFSHPAQQESFEIALLQIWATYRCKEDSPMSRLADLIDSGISFFADKKAKEKYQ